MTKCILFFFLCGLTANLEAQNVGIGTASPQVKLHVVKGSTTASPFTGSTMAVVSDNEAYLQLLTGAPETKTGLIFGDAQQNVSAGITFNFMGNHDLSFYTNASNPSLLITSQGNLGIGTLNPKAVFNVGAGKTVLFGNDTNGVGNKLIWYPQKAAFRVGYVYADQWDINNIGINSLASGGSTMASGYGSTAIGIATTASGDYSTAMGQGTIASGYSSTAMGNTTTASGDFSATMGGRTTAKSYSETVIGSYNTDYSPLSTNGWNLSDRLFVIGNGTPGNNSDALVILKNGNTGIGTSAPNAPLQFTTSNQKRKIVLFETANNDNQFFGFGVFGGQLRYQTGVLTDDHVFYSAASASVSNELMRIKGNGNVGIGTSAPNAPLQFANNTDNRKIVFYEAANNDHQFNGFGLNLGALRYQVNNTGDDHAFYAGISSSASTELFRIKGNGNVGVGTANPLSKLEINGAMATRMQRFLSGTSITLDNSATVWDLAPNMSITLPLSTSCPNRRYIIVNRFATPMTIAAPGYIDFNQAFSYQVPPNGSIELIAFENIWWRIK